MKPSCPHPLITSTPHPSLCTHEAQTCNPATSNWQIESTTDGASWSSPKEITPGLGPWAGSLVGPSNGIQLKHSKHEGRLVWCGHWGVYNSTQVTVEE